MMKAIPLNENALIATVQARMLSKVVMKFCGIRMKTNDIRRIIPDGDIASLVFITDKIDRPSWRLQRDEFVIDKNPNADSEQPDSEKDPADGRHSISGRIRTITTCRMSAPCKWSFLSNMVSRSTAS